MSNQLQILPEMFYMYMRLLETEFSTLSEYFLTLKNYDVKLIIVNMLSEQITSSSQSQREDENQFKYPSASI